MDEKAIFLKNSMEAILFASGDAVALSKMAKALEIEIQDALEIIKILKSEYENPVKGIEIIELDGKYQMRTNPSYYESVTAMLKLPEKKLLSNTLLETLAIIAYKQPVTKSQIEDIRGLSAGHAVNRLIELGFVCENGRLDAPGRPVLFATTEEFLRRFGISSLSQLPKDFDSTTSN